jgi:hypothetical protein
MDTQWQRDLSRRQNMERVARKILGVSASADRISIKKAFLLLAMQYHPDKNPRDRNAPKIFRNIVNAYEFLTKGKAASWHPDMETAEETNSENRIGDFLANDWGYFCWWRENYMDGDSKSAKPKRVRKSREENPADSAGDWW